MPIGPTWDLNLKELKERALLHINRQTRTRQERGFPHHCYQQLRGDQIHGLQAIWGTRASIIQVKLTARECSAASSETVRNTTIRIELVEPWNYRKESGIQRHSGNFRNIQNPSGHYWKRAYLAYLSRALFSSAQVKSLFPILTSDIVERFYLALELWQGHEIGMWPVAHAVHGHVSHRKNSGNRKHVKHVRDGHFFSEFVDVLFVNHLWTLSFRDCLYTCNFDGAATMPGDAFLPCKYLEIHSATTAPAIPICGYYVSRPRTFHSSSTQCPAPRISFSFC